MIDVRVGDLFKSEAQTLVNTVNCVGVMGKGVALEFKKRFPEMYHDYAARCAAKQVRLGEPYLYQRLLPPWILNFPTKDHWRSVSKLSDIVMGLEYLEQHYHEWGITSLAVPPLGCGQGQLEWRVVGPTLYRYLSQFHIPVELYAPIGTPQSELETNFLATETDPSSSVQPAELTLRINPAWVALVEILARIDREPYHWPVGRTTFQKIAYFATALGLPTGLQYSRGSYGPFSSELKLVTTRLVNNGLVREEPLGQMISVKPGMTYEDAAGAYQTDLREWEAEIDKITDLFLRMQTKQAEIAATVHFAARELTREDRAPTSELDVLGAVHQWKRNRRPPLADDEIALAIRNLNLLGWINVSFSAKLPLPPEAAET